ncbi:MAG: histidine phosphatase family protein [candidate division NC10 bacterium]|nr:histidine phosphatase family protein [candidate division NC10 bacterium]
MPRFILVRHGESVWNMERRIQGNLDPELSPRGRRQTDLLVLHLKAHLPDAVAAIYASPLRRAAQTAEQIAATYTLPVIQEPDLREMSLGQWEGMTVAEIQAASPGRYEQWLEDPLTFPAPGGEDLRAFERRVVGALQRMQAAHPGADLIVVSHGGVIKTLLCFALGLDVRFLFRLKQDNTAVSQVELDGRLRRVLLLNDTCHLNAGGGGVAARDVLTDAAEVADPAF